MMDWRPTRGDLFTPKPGMDIPAFLTKDPYPSPGPDAYISPGEVCLILELHQESKDDSWGWDEGYAAQVLWRDRAYYVWFGHEYFDDNVFMRTRYELVARPGT